jgi:predicted amidophosphoribosyltransferase
MAIVEIHPQPIDGPWIEGFVLDRHVISSTPTHYVGDHQQFDTLRTPLGELVYRLKNKGGPAQDVIDTAVDFVSTRWSGIDCVIAPPPSATRRRQPAVLIAAGVARALGVSYLANAVVKAKPTPQMKNVPTYEREDLLKDAIQKGPASVVGVRALIVDDLWQTGGTMRRVAEVLAVAGAGEIRVLAMTRTK